MCPRVRLRHSDRMRSRWLWLVLVLLLALVVWDLASDGSWVAGAVFAVVVLAFAWWTYPHRGSGQRAAGGSDRGEELPQVVIYWRPGCVFCARLRARLGGIGRRATWVNIWTDAEAAAYVRSVNAGNETVPTVVINAVAHTNPPVGLVRESLTRAA